VRSFRLCECLVAEDQRPGRFTLRASRPSALPVTARVTELLEGQDEEKEVARFKGTETDVVLDLQSVARAPGRRYKITLISGKLPDGLNGGVRSMPCSQEETFSCTCSGGGHPPPCPPAWFGERIPRLQ
jgi:hypothetical protein